MTPLPGAPNPLVGTWKLVSFQFEAEGSNERLDVYDEHPVGFIIFTADWRVLALVTASERADDETARALFDRMMAYSGRYRLRVDGCFITIVDSVVSGLDRHRADELLHARWRYVVDHIAATATPEVSQ
jgi:Lipocalin-like domain